MQDNIFALADRLQTLERAKQCAEEQLKALNGEIDEVRTKLADLMISEEMPNFTRNGRVFYLTTRLFASAIKQRKDELYQWLREHGFGDLVYETVNANSLAAFIREQLEEMDELPEALAGLVSVHQKTTVGIRKATARK
jgi:predicted nuclease with TOPRIM domain